MASPTSPVAICNLALDLLNEKSITVIDPPSTDNTTEQLCARWYDITRRKLLEAANWNFAQNSEAVPRSGTPSISRYADSYKLPNNYLKLTAIKDWDYPLQRWDYRIEGRNLLINNGGTSSIDLYFIQDIENVTIFPSYFSELLAGLLALNMARKLTAKPSVLNFLSEYITEARRVALGANGQVQPPRRYERSKIKHAGLNPGSANQIAGDYEFNFDPN